MVCIIVSTTLFLYFALMGNRHVRDRKHLKRELRDARMKVLELQEALDNEDTKKISEEKEAGKEVRIFFEGAFDVMHYGHANGFRQARALGTYLVAGVNSSESVEACKGAPPIMSDDERIAVVAACKWGKTNKK
jgi:ethanolamine-phosphate cytidylyltransferase